MDALEIESLATEWARRRNLRISVARTDVDSAIVSTLPLNLMSIGAALLLPLIFLYFGVLYSAFSGPIDVEDSY